MKNILQTLQRVGLAEKEASIYLALLDMGEATAAKLAERTGITRTLIYEITSRLMERGFVSSIVKEGVRYFSASEPKCLLRELEERTEDLRKIMPDLEAFMAATKKETKVALYRGRKGVNAVLRMIIDGGSDYYITGGGKEACQHFEHENKIFVNRAAKAGIKGYILARKGDNFFVGTLERFRYLPPQLISLVSSIVWNNNTAIFVWSEPCYVVVIENENIAKSNVSTFRYLWKTAEKPTKADIKRRTVE